MKSNEDKCETCGSRLAPGHVAGNHVRGDQDERCDRCIGKTFNVKFVDGTEKSVENARDYHHAVSVACLG